ncbi:family 78 glycoside hydrolase catalytic domain [Lacticaseibacillus kribbianus]|uniref:family 78 glycoside hydrolase catalytic domain n=1 Tax=Lacticaseibacillus kribbianus TaxID=2926292 RepID=UPI001CD1CB26|nr:family 78 glycoside hydrolase catalytic domain [Lacticaseibacillus kribbianus]
MNDWALGIQINWQARPVVRELERISWQPDQLGAALTVAAGTLTIEDELGHALFTTAWPQDSAATTAGPAAASPNAWTDFTGLALPSDRRLTATVTLTTTDGQTYRDRAPFFTAADFSAAQWVTGAPDGDAEVLLSAAVTATKPVASVTLYASARGLYELYAGATKVSADLLTPGWTSYDHTIQYQAYDLTALFGAAPHQLLSVRLAPGWYRGRLTWDRKRMYGDRTAFIAHGVIRYVDGSVARFDTAEDWLTAPGPIRASDLYDGEQVDLSHAQAAFLKTGDRAGWRAATVLELAKTVLTPQQDAPCQVTQRLAPVSATTDAAGRVVLDFGQNLVGRVRVDLARLLGGQPVTLTLHHSEVLDALGTPYFGNLRTAAQTVTIHNATAAAGTYAAHFSFQGFRYVEVVADRPLAIDPAAFVAEVIHTPMTRTGTFTCDDPLLNRLYANILWGQRGNFVDVPTDCPQRDERLGWTGDTQVFISTGLYNYDGYAFYRKWLQDLSHDQLPDGGVPAVIPDVVSRLAPETSSSAAWGDAAVICPWTLYQFYGDLRILREQYASMKAWVAFNSAAGKTPYSGNPGFHYGDWLALDVDGSCFGATPHDYIACCFHRYTAELLRRTALLLGETADAAAYAALVAGCDDFFAATYLKDDDLSVATQTAQVLALKMMGLTPAQRAAIAARLNQLVVNNNTHLNTGFVGTPYLLEVLTANGYAATAVGLLMQKTFPSWLYAVTKGATTIWEHWDGLRLDGTMWADSMNSFNHYAFGAVGNWIYRYVLGIDQAPTSAGFEDVVIAPLIKASKRRHVSGSYQSVRGNIAVAWANQDGRVQIRVHVPAETSGTLILQDAVAGSYVGPGTYEPEATRYRIPLHGGSTLTASYRLV